MREGRMEGGRLTDARRSASTTDLLAGRCCACDDKHCAILLSFRFTLGSFYQTSSSRSNKKITKIDVRRSCFSFVACSQLTLRPPSFCCAKTYNPKLKRGYDTKDKHACGDEQIMRVTCLPTWQKSIVRYEEDWNRSNRGYSI